MINQEIGILENSYLDAEIKTINKDEINVEVMTSILLRLILMVKRSMKSLIYK